MMDNEQLVLRIQGGDNEAENMLQLWKQNKGFIAMMARRYSAGAEMEDLDKLEELCRHLQSASLCALGQTAPNPVLSTLRYFRDEYIAHIVDKKCPAGVCKDLLHYRIDPDKCRGCTLCARTCPADAIIGKVKEVHMINPEKCVKCGACMEKCRFGAIYKE